VSTSRPPEELRVSGLQVEVATRRGWTPIVQGVDLHVQAGEIHGIVGESGSGKSLTALAIMGLLQSESHARVTGGTVEMGGTDLLSLSRRKLRRWQGNRLAMVFQEPMTSLNPAFTIGDQIAETMRYHLEVSRAEAWERAVELLNEVGIPDARTHARDYPHQYSGGMRQRVMLAIALACEPSLLIADEPTTALDVTVQAQILELISSLVERHEMGVIFITHDLAVVASVCDRVTVMYAGQVVESGRVSEVIGSPQHPYTAGLLASVPGTREAPLSWIRGAPPLPNDMPDGCRFHPRCEHALPECRAGDIPLVAVGSGRVSRCILTQGLDLKGRK